MALVKCPRCELNYMNDTDTMCSVCRREVRGESEQFEMIELCSECGENPVVPGQELCAFCLKEQQARRADTMDGDENVIHEAANIEIDSVSTMDEIELDIGGGLDDEDFEDDADFSEDDEDEEEEDDVGLDEDEDSDDEEL